MRAPSRRTRGRRLVAAGLVVGQAWVGGAQAAERGAAALDAFGPPAIPGLTHPELAFDFEYTFASVAPADLAVGPAASGRALAYSARWFLEAAIVPRRWFAGVIHDVGAASVPGTVEPQSGGNSIMLGNPELWGRGIWYNEVGLAAGGGLGVVIPVPRTFSPVQAQVVRAIRVVRPWDYAHFLDQSLTLRPSFDIRHVTGPVVLQLRQGVDVSLLARDRAPTENRLDLTALASLYVGFRPLSVLTVGAELSEVYQLTADVSTPTCVAPCDGNRATLTVSPALRLHLPRFSPTLSGLFPLSTPLRAEVDSYFGVRLTVDVEFDWSSQVQHDTAANAGGHPWL